MAKSWSGWRRSATNNTASELTIPDEHPMLHVINCAGSLRPMTCTSRRSARTV
jgi:hypothetical protein